MAASYPAFAYSTATLVTGVRRDGREYPPISALTTGGRSLRDKGFSSLAARSGPSRTSVHRVEGVDVRACARGATLAASSMTAFARGITDRPEQIAGAQEPAGHTRRRSAHRWGFPRARTPLPHHGPARKGGVRATEVRLGSRSRPVAAWPASLASSRSASHTAPVRPRQEIRVRRVVGLEREVARRTTIRMSSDPASSVATSPRSRRSFGRRCAFAADLSNSGWANRTCTPRPESSTINPRVSASRSRPGR